MADNDGSISFQRDIRPLFREVDVDHMSPMGVMLDQYDYMSDSGNAQAVYEFLTGEQQPQMPIGGPYWDAQQLALFAKWMAGGRKP